MIGERFGLLMVTGRAMNSAAGKRRWNCSCACGSATTVVGGDLRAGKQVSCGCKRRRVLATSALAHGSARRSGRSPTYRTWADMVKRCTNPRSWAWKYYGGRGITVCARWLDFANFLADMGERPAGLTLDRINNDGNYEPGNGRWATRLEQRHNRRESHAAA